MADIPYNKNAVLCALDTVNVAAYELPIKCDDKLVFKSISDLSAIADKDDLGLNPNARMQSYISAISANLLSEIPTPSRLNLTCAGSNSDFIMAGEERFQGQSGRQEDQLGGSDDGKPTWQTASDKVKTILSAIEDVFSNSLSSDDLVCNDVKYSKNENLYTCINAGMVHYKSTDATDRLIRVNDVLRDLNTFIYELDKIKYINVQYFFLSTTLSSGISWQFSFDGCVFNTKGEYAGVEGKIVVNYGPYVKRSNESINKCVYETTSTAEQTNDEIRLSNLVKCTNLRSDLILFDYKNQDGINGSHEIFLNVNETGKSLYELVPLKYILGRLNVGKIITLCDILKLIDEIFIAWINNIKQINYYVYICHYNCHGNVSFINQSQEKCCFCGDCAWGLNTQNCNS